MEAKPVYQIPDPGELQELYRTHWWFDGRSLDRIQRSVEHSDEVVGLRDSESGRLVASARVITDYVYTGKILDVIVDGPLRGRGLGTQLMAAVTNHDRLQDIDELTVNCRAGLAPFYEACGFSVHEMIQERGDGAEEDYYVMVYE